MKTFLAFFALSLLFSGISARPAAAFSQEEKGKQQVAARETITLESASELFPLTSSLVEAFQAAHPGVKVNLLLRGDQHSGEIASLCLLTEENLPDISGTSWKISVARDVIVPFLNAGNPMLDFLGREGLTRSEFVRLLTQPDGETWASLVAGGKITGIRVFLPAEERQRDHLAAFAGLDPSALKGETRESAAEMISAVQKDVFSMGFCRLSELTDPETNDLYAGIHLAPIDKNQNGRLDHFENIYTDKEEFLHGVWLGKYPKSLCSVIYAVAPSKPEGSSELAFLEWIISDGQQYLPSGGYGELAGIQQKTALEALAPAIAVTDEPENTDHSNVWMLALVTLFIAGLILIPMVLVRRKKPALVPEDLRVSAAFNEASVSAPAGIFFYKTHTWAFMEKEGLVKMGIDDFLQHITGSLTRIVMKPAGEKIRKGEVAVTIVREGKQLNLYAPVTGIIRKNNRKLETDCTLLNSSPYSEGWIYMIEPRNWLKDIQYMLMGESYKNWLNEEITRLKDFFASSGRKNSLVWSPVVLQDGGEIADHVLADLGPDVWEDFQTEFIDASK